MRGLSGIGIHLLVLDPVAGLANYARSDRYGVDIAVARWTVGIRLASPCPEFYLQREESCSDEGPKRSAPGERWYRLPHKICPT